MTVHSLNSHKTLRKKTEKNLHDTGFSNDIFEYDTQSIAIERKKPNWTSLRLRTFVHHKTSSKREKAKVLNKTGGNEKRR